MTGEDGYFSERVARRYDESSADMFLPGIVDTAVDVLAELTGTGTALELGIGTGRIALPLSQRGVKVRGIDLSRAMVARLHAKPGGSAIDVTIGDFSTAQVPDTFTLVYSVFNTITYLTSQEAQVACFRNVAAHLQPGGRFVVEAEVPEVRKLPPGHKIVPLYSSGTQWAFDVYDMATQSMTSNYVEVENGRGENHTIPFRYVWPAELDLMAQLAGLRLYNRWGGWTRHPFTHESVKHVSVWEKPAY
nr:class I SAM-dependent methyltransferase [Kibdelosporangium sp. MJ126-NF4]CEL18390.1 Methyltransferase SCO0408 [Kibdelosporangium sp. MJ126-NF4]CTQ97873.1 Methyltransferase SCO0408 [Kibdelosporangium sp. MJ126-NF4]